MNTDNMKIVSNGNAVQLSILNNGAALIRFDLQGKKVNLLSSAVMAELSAALDTLAGIPGVEGVVFYSGKDSNFIAGADVEEIAGIQTQPASVAFQATQQGKAVFAKISALPYPSVAVVHGSCRGGGAELLLWCDEVIAAEDTETLKTTFGYPEGGLGFLPGFGGNVKLIKRLGFAEGMPFILMPLRAWSAKKAWEAGLVSELAPLDKLLERGIAVALGAKPRRAKRSLKSRVLGFLLEKTGIGRKYFLRKGATAKVLKETHGNYPAPLASIDVALAALTMSEADALTYESRAFADLCVGRVSRNLVRFYLDREAAKRAPADVKPEIVVKEAGVIGCGIMGSAIVYNVANAGYKTVVIEAKPEALERGKGLVKALFDHQVEKGKISRAEADRRFGNITFSTDIAALANCDLVIEAIIENLSAKQGVLQKVEAVIKKPFIFASNTSSLKIGDIAALAAHPENVVGMHFFNPANIMELVEAIAGPKTSASTLVTVKIFASSIGKTVVTVSKDSPGFIVNRILAPYLYEAIGLFENGVPAADIDKAMLKFGMKMGPLALLDEIGFDIAGNVIREMNAAFGDRFALPRLLQYFVDNKLLGKKGGKGFYLYDQQGNQLGLNPELLAQAAKTPSPRKLEDIQDRLYLPMANEAAMLVAEGVPSKTSDVDLAMILGTGFAPFRGGVLRYADEIGSRVLLQKLEVLAKISGKNYEPAALVRQLAVSGKGFHQD